MTVNTQVLIIGGSINGATLALSLAQNNIEVTLIEPKTITDTNKLIFDGRAYALALTTKKMFSALNIWNNLENFSEPILDIKIGENKNTNSFSKTLLHFDHDDMSEESNPMGYILEDRYFRSELFTKIQNCNNIKIIDNCYVSNYVFMPGEVTAELSNGKTIKSKIIIGCDGQNSKIAKLAKINRFGWKYNQASLVCAIKHKKPHNNCAHQFFNPSGPIAILPLPKNRSSIVWTETLDLALKINELKPEEYINILKSKVGANLGDISLAGKRIVYPLKLSIVENFVSNRLALVGDSAHGIHPLAGQGLNLGMRDIASLVEVIVNAMRRGEDIGSLPVLKRYENWRRFETSALAVSTDLINKVFSNDNKPLRFIVNTALKSINSNKLLKKNIMREAAGLHGDLPRLLQGKLI